MWCDWYQLVKGKVAYPHYRSGRHRNAVRVTILVLAFTFEQDKLPELYCGHDALLHTSRHKAWSMLVLYAVALYCH